MTTGRQTVTAYICIKGAAQAIEFYTRAFGARETFTRITDSTGRAGDDLSGRNRSGARCRTRPRHDAS